MSIKAVDRLRSAAPVDEPPGPSFRETMERAHRQQLVRCAELEEALAEALEGWASLAPLADDADELARIEELRRLLPRRPDAEAGGE